MYSTLWFIIIAVVFVAIAAFASRVTKPRESDLGAIRLFIDRHHLHLRDVKQTFNYWRYWSGGNLLLSNISRVFVVTAAREDGQVVEYHLAFDPLSQSAEPRLLKERVVKTSGTSN